MLEEIKKILQEKWLKLKNYRKASLFFPTDKKLVRYTKGSTSFNIIFKDLEDFKIKLW